MKKQPTIKAFKFLGTTDTQTECGCCGRSNLKSTMIVEDTTTNEVFYFGSACGARAIGWGVKEFNKAATTAQLEWEKSVHRRFSVLVQATRDRILLEVQSYTASPVERLAMMQRWREESEVAYNDAMVFINNEFSGVLPKLSV